MFPGGYDSRLMKGYWSVFLAAFLLCGFASVRAQSYTTYTDIEYAKGGSVSLKLDLYVPNAAGIYPVVVYIHGGGWTSGDKANPAALSQAFRGYVVASINYRFIQDAIYPAQIYDCKAAIRWLRANAAPYKIDASRIGVWGASAGAHLAALLGTTSGVADLEDLSQGNASFSSSVKCVVDWFGPTDLLNMGTHGAAQGCGPAIAYDLALSPLIGCSIQSCKTQTQRANPIQYISAGDAPFLIMHGTADCTVPSRQSEVLHAALRSQNLESTLILYQGAGHGGSQFLTSESFRIINEFLDRHLKASTATTVSSANYHGALLAPEAIVSAFGAGLSQTAAAAAALPLPTSLGGTIVRVRDSAGSERDAPLFYVSPQQINYQIPPGSALGTATVNIIRNSSVVSAGTIQLGAFAPGIFSADASGTGLAAAVALRVRADGSQLYEPAIRYDTAQNRFVAVPIDLSNEPDSVFLILFGTGLRYRASLSSVSATVGGVNCQVTYAGAQMDQAGLDQLNILLPRTLSGRGEIDVAVNVQGSAANVVKVQIK
jgi:uncharacterized protein (TIGR03437 family)